MSAHCCPTPPSAVDPAYRRALWVALWVNALMFAVEAAASWRSGSLALLADSIDFFGDAANYALSLVVVDADVPPHLLADADPPEAAQLPGAPHRLLLLPKGKRL